MDGNNGSTHWINGSLPIYIPNGAAMFAFTSALFIIFVGIVGNLITIFALYRFSARLNSYATTTFVINLAIADLIFCSAVLPLNAGRYLTRSWPFGSFTCRLYPVFYYGTVASSLMLITVITINRLIMIAFNQRYQRIYTKRCTHLQIAFCWLFSFGIMAVPMFELWGRTGLHGPTFSCTILRDQWNRSPKKYLFTLGFVMPMSVIVCCYTIIMVHVRRQTRIVRSNQINRRGANGGNPSMNTKSRTSKRDLRLTLLISVVFGAFMLCFMPLFIGNVILPDDRAPYFHVLASICAWTNSCLNPFIYFALNPRYRNAFKRLFNIRSSYSINESAVVVVASAIVADHSSSMLTNGKRNSKCSETAIKL
ncbi:hypothetical protein BLOT_011242 [Blomia tropicalis]|nr:hypothetical protein BLOT_011242 [Blomia tropicalis]